MAGWLFGGGKPPAQAAPAPAQNPSPLYKPIMGNPGDEYAGVMGQYAGQENSPYWNQWVNDLKSGKLAGQDTYFFDKYAQNAQGMDAFKKQQEAEQAQIQGQYGDLQGQLQENMNQRGLARSGLMRESLGRLAGAEQGGLDALQARIDADRQRFTQGLQSQWMMEREDEKERKERKRKRKYGVASSILGGAGAIGGMALGGPPGAMLGSQVGSNILGGGY